MTRVPSNEGAFDNKIDSEMKQGPSATEAVQAPVRHVPLYHVSVKNPPCTGADHIGPLTLPLIQVLKAMQGPFYYRQDCSMSINSVYHADDEDAMIIGFKKVCKALSPR